MSKIYVLDKKTGTVEHLTTSSDSFLLFVYVAAQMTIFPVSWLLALIGSFVLHAAIDLVWLVRLSRRKYRRLSRDFVPEMVETIAKRLFMRSVPPIFIDTTRLDCTAKVIPYMFGGAVLMSSGLLMKAMSNDAKAEGIIAHELAHVQHGDYALFRFSALILIAPFANIFVLAGRPLEEWLMQVAAVTVAFFVYNAFLRRRELYADARAMNAMLHREPYLSYFRKDSIFQDGTATHPPSSQRLYSLETECIVSKTSGFMICMGLLVSAGVAKKAFDWTQWLELAVAAGVIHIATILILELSKPGINTIPMTYVEWRETSEADAPALQALLDRASSNQMSDDAS